MKGEADEHVEYLKLDTNRIYQLAIKHNREDFPMNIPDDRVDDTSIKAAV